MQFHNFLSYTLKLQAYNLEHNKGDPMPYKAYWEYLNAVLFKKLAIPEHPKILLALQNHPNYFSAC